MERKLAINIETENTSFSLNHNFSTLYNEHRSYQLWDVIDLFLVFVDRNFFIQHSFSIDFPLQQECEQNIIL